MCYYFSLSVFYFVFLLPFPGLGHVNVDVICEAILKAKTAQHPSILPAPSDPIASSPSSSSSSLLSSSSLSSSSLSSSPSAPSSSSAQAEIQLKAFTQPQLTREDLQSLRSWMAMELLPNKIVWVLFSLGGGGDSGVTGGGGADGVDGGNSDGGGKRGRGGGKRQTKVVKEAAREVKVEDWGVSELDFTPTSLISVYSHARSFTHVKTALDR